MAAYSLSIQGCDYLYVRVNVITLQERDDAVGTSPSPYLITSVFLDIVPVHHREGHSDALISALRSKEGSLSRHE